LPFCVRLTRYPTADGQPNPTLPRKARLKAKGPGATRSKSSEHAHSGVTVALGTGGKLSVTFVAPAPGPVAHVIFDVTGCFLP
jgi:hypothetical protein